MIEVPDDVITAYAEVMRGPIAAKDRPARVHAALAAALGTYVRQVEGRRGSGLCDCDGFDSEPTNPMSGARMDHHCDCTAVTTAAKLLGAYSETVHAQQCDHGTSMDEFYQAPVAGVPPYVAHATAEYPHRCPGCGNHYRKPESAAGCDADHRDHAARVKRTTGSN